MQLNNKVYELKGKSLVAVLTLREKVISELRPVMTSLVGSAAAFHEKHKDLYEAAGMNSRSIKVNVIQGCHPRAYAYTPEVFFHPHDSSRAYMYAPTDFKGRSFIPEDGLLLTQEQSETVAMGLWSGGWSDPLPVVYNRPPYGVQVPSDFDPNAADQNFAYADAPFDHKQASRLMKAIEYGKHFYTSENAIVGVKEPEDFSFDSFILCEDDGRPSLMARAVRKSDGAVLEIKPNFSFTPIAVGDKGFYKLVPVPKTAGGMAFKSFFDAIPTLSPEEVWKACDAADISHFIAPPPPPMALQHLKPDAPWPFPKSAPAP